MTNERRPDDLQRHNDALANSLVEIIERIAELETYIAVMTAAVAEAELTRRAVRELIGRVDALEDRQIDEISDLEMLAEDLTDRNREIVDVPIVDEHGRPI